jgi:hypothetical protein
VATRRRDIGATLFVDGLQFLDGQTQAIDRAQERAERRARWQLLAFRRAFDQAGP